MEPAVMLVIGIGVLLVGLALFLALRRAGASRYQDMEAPLSAETPAQFARGEDLPPELVYDVRVLMEAGRKIEAVKRVREVTHWGLKEAKDYVESLTVPAGTMSRPPATGPRPSMSQEHIPAQVLGEVQDLLARHEKIEAIKRVREVTHWGLKEAKDYVDAIEVVGGLSPAGRPYGNLSNVPVHQREISAEALGRVQDLLARRQKIEAIKVVREVTNWGLKEAKDFVDELEISR